MLANSLTASPSARPVGCWCRGQVGKQVVEQLSVERVRDLAVFEAKEFTALFGTATGVLTQVHVSTAHILQSVMSERHRLRAAASLSLVAHC